MLGVFFYLIILFIRPQDWPGTFIYDWPVTSILVPIMVLLGVVGGKKRPGTQSMPQHLLLVMVVLLAFLTNIVNGDSELAMEQFHLAIPKIMVFYAFFLTLDSYEKVSKAMAFMALMGVILSFQGMHQVSTGIGWANQGMHGHSYYASMDEMMSLLGYEAPRSFWIGDWDGPNVLALVYIVGIPYCLEKMFSKTSVVFKGAWFGALAMLCVGIKQTDSRGGFLGLAFCIMIFMLLRFGVKRGGVIGAVFLVLALGVAAPGRISQMDSKEESAHERTWLWERGLDWWREKPVLGMGKGTFAAHAGIIAHNNYVEVLAETGFVGLCTFMGLLYFSLRGAFLAMRSEIRERGPGVFCSSRASLVTLAGFSLATFFVTMQLEILFVLYSYCAACTALSPEAIEAIRLRPKEGIKVMTLAVLVISLIYLVAVKQLI